MTVPTDSLPTLLLKPGELFIVEEPCVVWTLLGSCVAVTMVSRRIGVGAICHALLPSCKPQDRCDCPERFRYVECAIRGMLREFACRGVPYAAIEVKLFGGADMFHGPGGDGVGGQNIAKAKNVLAEEGMQVSAFDGGGLQGRKILFYPHTGEVFLRRLDRLGQRKSCRGETA